jgi:putative membrane protein
MTAAYALTSLAAYGGGGWGNDGDGWWIFGPLFGLLWIALIATVVYLIVRRSRPHEPTAFERARDILAERYARGEITGEEYRERLAELQ